jgi:DNA-binding transcriptional LysR family regulator
MPITLNQLATFLAVARAGSVSTARQAPRDPAVDLCSARARCAVGIDHGARARHRAHACRRGRRPYAAASSACSTRARAARSGRCAHGTLRLVAVATAARYLVPPMLREFTRLHPEIGITLEVANRNIF